MNKIQGYTHPFSFQLVLVLCGVLAQLLGSLLKTVHMNHGA